MKRLTASAAAMLFATAAPLAAHDFSVGGIAVDHPMAFATPPGARAAGAYMTIANDGDAADRLIGVTADFPKVELHETIESDGIARMLPVASVELPPGRDVAFEPGGLHVMFMGLEAPLEEGAEIPATLTFERAGDLEVVFVVETRGAAGADHGDHGGPSAEDDGAAPTN